MVATVSLHQRAITNRRVQKPTVLLVCNYQVVPASQVCTSCCGCSASEVFRLGFIGVVDRCFEIRYVAPCDSAETLSS